MCLDPGEGRGHRAHLQLACEVVVRFSRTGTERQFERRGVHESDVRAELHLRPSASAATPSGPRRMSNKLSWGGGTETRANQSGVRALSSRLERGQRRIALETLSECGPTLGTEGVLEQTADGLTLTGEGGASKSACRFEKEGYLTALTVRFFDKSNARSFASAASRPRLRKSMSVCSGWMPQSVMICDISEAEDTIASALSPSEFLSRLNRGRCVNRS